MKKLVVIVALLSSACTTASTVMFDERTAMIDAHGSAWNSSSDVVRKALKEAATMAQARGYSYFAILSAQDASSSGVAYIPGQATTNTQGSAYCNGGYCSGNATSTTTGGGPQYVPYTRPGTNVMVRFLKVEELTADRTGVYEVKAILSSMK